MTLSKSSNFYTFFFTHLAQAFNYAPGQLPLLAYLQTLRPSENAATPLSASENNVTCLLTAEQPVGQLTLSVAQGHQTLDASATIPANASLTVDASTQPIADYSLKLLTPLQPPLIERRQTFTLSQVRQTPLVETFPQVGLATTARGTYPNQVTKVLPYVRNLWFSEPATYTKLSPQPNDYSFQFLTVDSSQILTNQQLLPNDQSAHRIITADRTLSYLNLAAGSVLTDQQPDFSQQKLTFEQVPAGDAVLSWQVAQRRQSAVWFPGKDRGYLPAATLGLAMTGARLEELAIALLTLSAQGDDQLALSMLRELCYWQQVLLPTLASTEQTCADTVVPLAPITLTPGLPDFLPRAVESTPPVSNRRTTLQQAWLGLAIVRTVRFLNDRPVTVRPLLPAGLSSLLQSLAVVVAQAIQPEAQVASIGFDEYGYRLEASDLPSLAIAQLFLHSYLSLTYDQEVHHQAASAFTAMLQTVVGLDFDPTTDQHVPPSATSEVSPLRHLEREAIYKLFWNAQQQIHVDTEALFVLLRPYLNTPEAVAALDPLLAGLLTLTLQTLKQQGFSVLPPTAAALYRTVAPGLQVPLTAGSLDDPSLTASSWSMLLTLSNPFTLTLLDFRLHALEATAFQAYSYRESRRLFPYGYAWSSLEAENPQGTLGSLLYSHATSLFYWYLTYALVRSGESLTTAQGWALDQLSLMLRRPRLTLESDASLRTRLLFSLTNPQSNLSALQTLIHTFYGGGVVLQEPTPLSVSFTNPMAPLHFVPWSTDPTQLARLLPDTPVQVARPLYPAKSRSLDGLTLNTSWAAVTSRLQILIDEEHPHLESEISALVSAGVALTFTKRSLDTSQSYTFMQEASIASSL